MFFVKCDHTTRNAKNYHRSHPNYTELGTSKFTKQLTVHNMSLTELQCTSGTSDDITFHMQRDE